MKQEVTIWRGADAAIGIDADAHARMTQQEVMDFVVMKAFDMAIFVCERSVSENDRFSRDERIRFKRWMRMGAVQAVRALLAPSSAAPSAPASPAESPAASSPAAPSAP